MDLTEKEIEEVIDICSAYESGYSAGRMNLSIEHNIYLDAQYKKNYYAWMLGHNTGIQAEMIELEEILPN